MVDKTVVLDTHVWIWYVNGDDQIKPPIKQIIIRTLKTGVVLVPSICVWEVGMLLNKNRIQLRQPLSVWVRQALEQTGFRLIPLNEVIAVESTTLPGTIHSDPADSMIIATARIQQGTLITRDSRIISYARAGHLKVLEA